MWLGNKTITFGYHVALLLTIIVQCNPFTVHGASESDLFYTEFFLKSCHKGCFISYPVSIEDLLERQDCGIF